MNDQLNVKPSVTGSSTHEADDSGTAIDKQAVTKYLLANPNFLIDNPELLVEIQVQLQANGVVSLTQIQAAQSREKIKQLKSQLEEMVINARQNEVIYTTYADLNLDLARSSSLDDLNNSLTQHLVTGLQLESAQIVLLNSNGDSEHQLSEIQHRSIFDKKLAREPFYFGRIGKIEKEALFPNSKAESVALILLNGPQDPNNKQAKATTLGLLAIASSDPLHFQPDMDTVLVDYLRKNLNVHISRLL